MVGLDKQVSNTQHLHPINFSVLACVVCACHSWMLKARRRICTQIRRTRTRVLKFEVENAGDPERYQDAICIVMTTKPIRRIGRGYWWRPAIATSVVLPTPLRPFDTGISSCASFQVPFRLGMVNSRDGRHQCGRTHPDGGTLRPG